MRIYSELVEAVKETERELNEMGTKVHPETYQDQDVSDNDKFETLELQGYGYIITGHSNLYVAIAELEMNSDYLRQEMADRVDSSWLNPGNAFLERQEVWEEFRDNGGKFAYTYNERFREQLDPVIEELLTRPNSRQAVMTMYDRHQDLANLGGKRRIPCSMYYQMLRRERQGKQKLDLIYTMRSCDFYTHYLYDVVLAMRMQEHIAGCLGLEPGYFTHFIGSLHAYKKDYESRKVF